MYVYKAFIDKNQQHKGVTVAFVSEREVGMLMWLMSELLTLLLRRLDYKCFFLLSAATYISTTYVLEIYKHIYKYAVKCVYRTFIVSITT